MNKSPTSEISSDTYGGAISRAERFLNEGTEQSLLASTLLIINALEATLNQIIYIELQNSITDILHQKVERFKIIPIHYGYNLEYILEKNSLRQRATLGVIIEHIDKYLLFPEKEKLLKLLKSVNKSREKIVHQLLITSQKSGISNKYLKTQAQIIFESSKKAMSLSYVISDKCEEIRKIQTKRK